MTKTSMTEGMRREAGRQLGYAAGGRGSRNWLHGHRIYKTGKIRRVRLPHKGHPQPWRDYDYRDR